MQDHTFSFGDLLVAGRRPNILLAAMLVVAMCSVSCHAAQGEGSISTPASNNWVYASATFFDAPPDYKKGIAHEYGTLYTGACSYTNNQGTSQQSNADLLWSPEYVAAISDVDPQAQSAGLCGRCFEVACVSGPVQSDYQRGLGVDVLPSPRGPTFQADQLPNWKDEKGRAFPWYPNCSVPPCVDKVDSVWAKCWDEGSIFVRTSDVCKCKVGYAEGGPKPGFSFWCCGPAPHIDLSYWGFSKLAHPLYGAMTVRMRPVDCGSVPAPAKAPTPSQPVNRPAARPGGASSAVYDNGILPGWAVRLEKANGNIQQRSPSGGTEACVTLNPGGFLAFWCIGCERVVGSTVSLWLRGNSGGGSSSSSSGGSAAGGTPALRVRLSNLKGLGEGSAQVACSNDVDLRSNQQVQRSPAEGGYTKFVIPLSAFGCGTNTGSGGITTATDSLNRLELASMMGSGDENFCVGKAYVA